MQKERYARNNHANGILDALVSSARLLATIRFPATQYPGYQFDAPRWDLNRDALTQTRPLYAHFYDVPGQRLYTARRRGLAKLIPPVFADIVKAWIIHLGTAEAQMANQAQHSRELWYSLTSATPNHPPTFLWDELNVDDLRRAAVTVQERRAKSAYKVEGDWGALLAWIQSNEILGDGFEWQASSRIRYDALANPNEKPKRLPNRLVLEALAQIYTKHAVSPDDRLVICALGLLLIGGFRISELCTLPLNCLVTERKKGRTDFGIRYWNCKTPDGAYKHAVRWLSPIGSELAKVCLRELRALTRNARRQAIILEESGRVDIPGLHKRKWLSENEASQALCLAPISMRRGIRSGKLNISEHYDANHVARFLRSEVEAVLLERRGPLRTLRVFGSDFQRLSDTLLICFEPAASIHDWENKLLVRAVPPSVIAIFVGATGKRSASAFERFGFNRECGKEAGSEPMRFHPHMLRHWLNTVANRAGMSVFQISLWFSRDMRSTKLYLHDSRDIADLSRELLRSGSVAGRRATEFDGTPDHDKEAYLSVIKHH